VWRGEGFDGRADLFSLGVLLHEMVGGGRVFLSDQAAELRAMIESGPPPAPSADARLQQIITRALQPDPPRRFASATEMRSALEAIVGGRVERARADLGTLVRRLAMPRERRTGAFAAVTLPPEVAGAVTPLGGKPPPIPGTARPWAPPVPRPPIGPVLSPVPLHNTLAGIGPDDVTVAPEPLPTRPSEPRTEPGMRLVADDAETRRLPRDDDETNRVPRTDAAELVAKTPPAPPEVSFAVPVQAEGMLELVAAPADPHEVLPPPIPEERAEEAAALPTDRPTERSGVVEVAVAPEPSWTPVPLSAAPPSPQPTFATPFEVRPDPIERPRSSVPGTRLPPRHTANRLIAGGIAALAVAGLAAVYVGLTGGRHPEERATIGTAQGVPGTGGTASPETKTEPSGEAKGSGSATAQATSSREPGAAATLASKGEPSTKAGPAVASADNKSGTSGEAASPSSATAADTAAKSTASSSAAASAGAASGAAKAPGGVAIEAKLPTVANGISGGFTIESTPPGATVFVDGEPRGTTPVRLTIANGSHNLVVAEEHQKLVKRDVDVKAGGRVELSLEPARLPSELSGHAGLKVRCHSQGELRILVDGVDTGLTCPNDERISVAPGTHKIGLYSPRSGALHEVEHEVVDAEHSTRVYVKF
jgi:hypothetical protein